MDNDKAWYVFRYYSHLMNEQERAANRHLTGTIKATHGRSDAGAQTEARSGPRHLREMLSDEAQVLDLASGGFQAFCAANRRKDNARPSRENRAELLPAVWSASANADRLTVSLLSIRLAQRNHKLKGNFPKS